MFILIFNVILEKKNISNINRMFQILIKCLNKMFIFILNIILNTNHNSVSATLTSLLLHHKKSEIFVDIRDNLRKKSLLSAAIHNVNKLFLPFTSKIVVYYIFQLHI